MELSTSVPGREMCGQKKRANGIALLMGSTNPWAYVLGKKVKFTCPNDLKLLN
jgi:hypothetical protein